MEMGGSKSNVGRNEQAITRFKKTNDAINYKKNM